VVEGAWPEGDGKVIYLQNKVGTSDYESFDSTTVVDGKFRLAGPLVNGGITIAVLYAGGSAREEVALQPDVVLLVSVIDKLNPKTEKTFVHIASIDGGLEQQVLKKSRQLAMGKGFLEMGMMLMMMQVKDDSVKLDSIYRVMTLHKTEREAEIRHFIDSCSGYVTITAMIADYGLKSYPIATIDTLYAQLTPKVKKSALGKDLAEQIVALKRVNIGGTAPDITLADTAGNTISLASLRGKYVLLDFWASWCGPCRKEFPNVKAIYDEYRDKGFEIYAVSLDDKRGLWTNAIVKNELGWLHVSSLEGWKCPVAKLYNVTGIPKMYLLDKDGVIVAQDLRGEELRAKVASFFE
jgi:peroxiredoxin